MDRTGISWTDATWNPTFGCKVVSAGCANCYAMRIAGRFAGPGKPYEGLVAIAKNKRAVWNGNAHLSAKALTKPLGWRAPRRIFVNSTSDLFYEGFSDEQIDQVLAVMLLSPQHTFQVLTKRARRMREYMTNPRLYERVLHAAGAFRAARPELNQIAIDNPTTCPKPWIWLGVSVENQDAADERIPELLATPAAIRFLSCEPLIGPVDLEHVQHNGEFEVNALAGTHGVTRPHGGRGAKLDWVIAGCESGPGARKCDVAWLRSLRDQCSSAGVAYFLKQAVGTVHENHESRGLGAIEADVGSKRKSGGVVELPYLDGSQHAEFPEVRR